MITNSESAEWSHASRAATWLYVQTTILLQHFLQEILSDSVAKTTSQKPLFHF